MASQRLTPPPKVMLICVVTGKVYKKNPNKLIVKTNKNKDRIGKMKNLAPSPKFSFIRSVQWLIIISIKDWNLVGIIFLVYVISIHNRTAPISIKIESVIKGLIILINIKWSK